MARNGLNNGLDRLWVFAFMATFLVTGGCGFIGSHLVDALLARGDDVRVLDDLSTGKRGNIPTQAHFISGDVRDAALLDRAMAGVDGCFHLAAIASVARSNEDWSGTHSINLGGAIAVFDAAARAGRKPVVYASSAAVYGDCAEMPLSEASPTRPLSAYGADKLGCELHARVAGIVHGVPSFGLRFFNVFGPRQDPKSPYSGVISIFARQLLDGQPLSVLGDGEQVRDFIHISDVVGALMRAMDAASLEAPVSNVCSGRPVTINQLAEALSRAAGRPAEIRHMPARVGDIRVSIGDPARARALLALPEAISLDQGLATLLD